MVLKDRCNLECEFSNVKKLSANVSEDYIQWLIRSNVQKCADVFEHFTCMCNVAWLCFILLLTIKLSKLLI